MSIAVFIYLLSFALILYIVFSPNVKEYSYLKWEYQRLFSKLNDYVSQNIIKEDYKLYAGNTKVFYKEIFNQLLEVQSELESIKNAKTKSEYRKSVSILTQSLNTINNIKSKLSDLEQKERDIQQYLSDLKIEIALLPNEQKQRTHDIIEQTSINDVLVAYNIMKRIKETNEATV